jgi:DNA ligase-1
MPDLLDGQTIEWPGSGSKPYQIKNVGGVYSCSCPAWRNQSLPIERRTCKHIRAFRGEAAEAARLGAAALTTPASRKKADTPKDTPPLLLAEKWEETDIDLAGWWMSEKLDGVRAYWNGQVFISRLGNPFHAPDWFVAGLPPDPLDGELWIARKSFSRTSGIVRRQDKTDLWREVKYLVFDAPAVTGPFEERLAFVRDFLGRNRPPFAAAHAHERCRDLAHLKGELARVEGLGGEGLMMRQPGSRYEIGRSYTLLKVKNFQEAEARVLEHLPGAGRHKGRLGALGVELPDGTRFSVGTGFSDAEREAPPPVGSVITFRYQELSEGGVPRFPSYVGVRFDTTGEDNTVGKAKVQKTTTATVPAAPPPAAPAAPAPTAAAPATGPARRRFEFVEGSSNKFWEVWVEGNNCVTQWGKIGTDGRETVKGCDSPAEAQAMMAKLIAEKTKKGYKEKTAPAGAGAAAPAPAPAPAPAAAAPTPAAPPAAPAPAAETPAAPAAAPAPAPAAAPKRRRFEFVEGSSNKFWEVWVEGNDCVTQWGKIGTDGRETVKGCDSPAEAQAMMAKLIAEKTKKGYKEKTR